MIMSRLEVHQKLEVNIVFFVGIEKCRPTGMVKPWYKIYWYDISYKCNVGFDFLVHKFDI